MGALIVVEVLVPVTGRAVRPSGPSHHTQNGSDAKPREGWRGRERGREREREREKEKGGKRE